MGSSNTLHALKSLLRLKTNMGHKQQQCFVHMHIQIRKFVLYNEQNMVFFWPKSECMGINTARAHKIIFDRAARYACTICIWVWRSRSDLRAKSKCLTTPIQIENYPKTSVRAKKNAKVHFLWDTLYVYTTSCYILCLGHDFLEIIFWLGCIPTLCSISSTMHMNRILIIKIPILNSIT